MAIEKVDIAIVLGEQLLRGKFEWDTFLAPHTKLRAEAARTAYRNGVVKYFITCGGHCFYVRYDPQSNEVLRPPNFSFEALARASRLPTEAELLKEYISADGAIPFDNIIAEKLSLTTAENAQCVKIILSRTLALGLAGIDPSSLKKIGIITQSAHMERALEEFRKVGLEASPVSVEELLG